MVTAPPQAGSALLAAAHELPLFTLVPVLLCAGGILLPWAKPNETLSPPCFSLPAVHFSLLLCNSSSQSDPPRFLRAYFLPLLHLPSIPTSDSPSSETLLLPDQNPAAAAPVWGTEAAGSVGSSPVTKSTDKLGETKQCQCPRAANGFGKDPSRRPPDRKCLFVSDTMAPGI